MTEKLYYTGIGSRETPAEICRIMTDFARRLAQKNYILRSGGASGADSAFEEGAPPSLREIYLPWQGFNGKRSDMVILPLAAKIAQGFHPAWHKLSDGGRRLHTRNVHQVLGADLKTLSKFVVCWTSNGKASGGTGQALRIALDRGVPVYNLFHRSDILMLDQFINQL